MKRFAWLEIERAVLDLDGDVGAECAIESGKLEVGSLGAVGVNVLVIDKCAPDDVAFVWSKRVGEDVRTFGVCAPVSLWAGLAFGVCFDEKTAEVGDETIN